MNCEEAKQRISIRMLLESFSLSPAKENGRSAFYFALDREERTPSFFVDYVKNTAFDFGTGVSYDIISIVRQINKCSVSDALNFLENINRIVISEKHSGSEKQVAHRYNITKVSEIQHPALIRYLKSRKVSEQRHWVREVHYQIKSRAYFGVGFQNNSGGFEIRNQYAKICLGKKDITLHKNILNSENEIVVFEGFFDFLTYKKMMTDKLDYSDCLILNSVTMLFKAQNLLSDYSKISLFLDNDTAGERSKNIIKNTYENVEDCSFIYRNVNDLNEWICSE
ncbi:toprim domain-containing protein [Chryseobacterium sp. SIMBA_038]|uniref:toprim domain-containing protein n=1 Tax=Chryseobacterium sp. SIMBA_038 TaxID=3085780 RepID=UPI00397B936C